MSGEIITACKECGAAFTFARDNDHAICMKCLDFEAKISKANLLRRINELERLCELFIQHISTCENESFTLKKDAFLPLYNDIVGAPK